MSKKKLRPELVGIFDDLIDETVEILPDIPETRETPRQLLMFWREEKCSRCHTIYEGAAYGWDVMLQLVKEKPIVHFGRFYGWKYVGLRFIPVPDLSCYDHLPRSVEVIHSDIRVCPRCVHRPKVIYLEASNG